jgi:tRNA A-37 threonylcarbamoyl transferase component Bud32
MKTPPPPFTDSSAASAPWVTAGDLRAAGRTPACPFRMQLGDGSELLFTHPLRVLPGKRVVGQGLWNGTPVLAKLFIARESTRHWEREQKGILALRDACLPTPPVLAAGTLAQGGHYLLTRFLDGARPLDTQAATLQDWLRPAADLLGRMHAQGLLQTDPHLNNFLRHDDLLYLIDGDGVQSYGAGDPDAPRRNLALFLAQLPVRQASRHAEALDAYRQAFPSVAIAPESLSKAVRAARARRLRDFLDKSVRDCSQFKVERTFGLFTVVSRQDAERLAPILKDPDAWMARGIALKEGNTSTVARVDLNDRAVVIKRYNIKNLPHAASRFWRPSRAWHAWREGHRLNMLGIHTPTPLALIEQRLGSLRGKAWLVSDHVPGENLLAHSAAWLDTGFPAPEQTAILAMFQDLAEARIVHGDMKATNLIWNDGVLVLIDLDATRQYHSESGFCRAHQRDVTRFLANWPHESYLRRSLEAAWPSPR